MRILLLKPRFNDIAVMPPMGLCYLAPLLAKAGFEVDILDNTLLDWSDGAVAGQIRERGYRLVGIYASTPMIDEACRMASLIKSVDRSIHVCLGGPHPSVTVEETLGCSDVDSIGMGECEKILPELARRIDAGGGLEGVSGLAWRDGAGVVRTQGPGGYIPELDSLPFPDFSKVPVARYFKVGHNYGVIQRSSRNLPIITSRGCPSRCTFCQLYLGRKFRTRSPANIADEIALGVKTWGVREFNFLDDNFTVYKKWAIDVCREIGRRDLAVKIRFPNGVREDRLDEEMLAALRDVGCYHLDFGLESGCQHTLDLMQKDKQVPEMGDKVWLAHRMGFETTATFIFGTPGETLADMDETIRFALSLPLDSASFGIVIPFPGTELRQEAIAKGHLVHSRYRMYNPGFAECDPPLRSADWTAEELIAKVKEASRRFYFRPRMVLKYLPYMFRGDNLVKYVRAARDLMPGRHVAAAL